MLVSCPSARVKFRFDCARVRRQALSQTCQAHAAHPPSARPRHFSFTEPPLTQPQKGHDGRSAYCSSRPILPVGRSFRLKRSHPAVSSSSPWRRLLHAAAPFPVRTEAESSCSSLHLRESSLSARTRCLRTTRRPERADVRICSLSFSAASSELISAHIHPPLQLISTTRYALPRSMTV